MQVDGVEVSWAKSVNPSEADVERGNYFPYVSEVSGHPFLLAKEGNFHIHSSETAASSLAKPERGDKIALTVHGRILLVAEFTDEKGPPKVRKITGRTVPIDAHYYCYREVKLVQSYAEECAKGRSAKIAVGAGGHCVPI